MKKYRHAVAAVVLKDDQILLVHKPRKFDAWQLPQGGIEEGESHEQAAKRELKEETGLTVTETLLSCKETYSYDFPPEFVQKFQPVNDGQTLCFCLFRVPADAAVCVDNVEIDDHAWVMAAELPRYIARPQYLAAMRNVLAEVSGLSR